MKPITDPTITPDKLRTIKMTVIVLQIPSFSDFLQQKQGLQEHMHKTIQAKIFS
jgi:hypothetical protein